MQLQEAKVTDNDNVQQQTAIDTWTCGAEKLYPLTCREKGNKAEQEPALSDI